MATITVTLPNYITCANQLYILQVDTTFVANLTPTGGDLVNGINSVLTVNGPKVVVIYCDGDSGWAVSGN